MNLLAPIMGAYFRKPAPAILQVLPMDTPLRLEREPTNQYDPNAIKVWVETVEIPESMFEALDAGAQQQGSSLEIILEQEEWWVGFVAKAIAAEWTECFDQIESAVLGFTMEGKPAVKITLKS